MALYVSRTAFLNDGGLTAVPTSTLPDPNCTICFRPYRTGRTAPDDPCVEEAARLPCGHVLGLDCILQWTLSNTTCPYCRAELFPPPYKAHHAPLHHEPFDFFDDSVITHGGFAPFTTDFIDATSYEPADEWEQTWYRSVGVDEAYIPLGDYEDPLAPMQYEYEVHTVPSQDTVVEMLDDWLLDQPSRWQDRYESNRYPNRGEPQFQPYDDVDDWMDVNSWPCSDPHIRACCAESMDLCGDPHARAYYMESVELERMFKLELEQQIRSANADMVELEWQHEAWMGEYSMEKELGSDFDGYASEMELDFEFDEYASEMELDFDFDKFDIKDNHISYVSSQIAPLHEHPTKLNLHSILATHPLLTKTN
ncbi:hypothetical protein BDV95DRAFT_590063 [Massariosphaeria phaeospora]|uniref:RING-type domain-containing protein n=1 Tax=Massariosphaeria phaeospora TaxID=100035 RepID=A0A7C8MJZ4_9PLEO|nr:hypothetical protein BDV95DRAFT_590063 [Massariosphaeria phaeospora]